MMPWIALARADAFYEQRLKAGKDALAARRGPEAVEELRIAVFGFIDEPRQLAEALAYLTIAQNGLGRTADVEASLTRFVETERRAAGYDRQMLPEEVRVQFETLLVKQFGRTALAAVPSLAPIVSGEPGRRTATAPAVPPVVPPAPSGSSLAAPQNDVRPTPPQGTPASSTQAPQNDDRATSGAAPAVPPPAQQSPQPRLAQNDVRSSQPSQQTPAQSVSQLSGDGAEQARQLISTRRAAQAVGLLTTAAEREPQRRELKLLLLQAAAMTSDWKLALSQIALLRPFSDTEPVFMFYAAVTMWESNRQTEARELLDRALPRLNRTPYVESYVRKILPERATS